MGSAWFLKDILTGVAAAGGGSGVAWAGLNEILVVGVADLGGGVALAIERSLGVSGARSDLSVLPQ